MDFADLLQKVKKIKQAYHLQNRVEGYKVWRAPEYLQGLQGDVGDLAKLVLASSGFAFGQKDIDKRISRELADLLWSVLVLADEFDVDLEQEFGRTLQKLEEKIQDRKVVKPSSKPKRVI